MLLTRLSRNWFTLHKSVKPIIDIESQTIVDPSAYEDRSIVGRIQNWMNNKSCLNDLERSLKDVKRKNMSSRFLGAYNKVVEAVEDHNFEVLEDNLSPTLFKVALSSLRLSKKI